MKVFRSSHLASGLIFALVLDLSGMTMPFVASTVAQAAEGPADIRNPNVPLMAPMAIATSCDGATGAKGSVLGGVQTGNPVVDAGTQVASKIFEKEDEELEAILNDAEDEASGKKNACAFKGKMDVNFDCEAAYPKGGVPDKISSDPKVACELTVKVDMKESFKNPVSGATEEVSGLDWKKLFPEERFEENRQAVCLGACRKRKVDVLLAEKACLDQVENNLREQLKKYSTLLNQYSQQVEQTLSDVDGELKERETILKEMSTILGGDKATGKMGLMEAQKTLKTLDAQLPAMAKAVKASAEALKRDQEAFKTSQKQIAMNRAVSCFKNDPSTSSGFTCDGKRVSPYRYIECQLNKKYSKSKGNLAILERKKKELAEIVSQIEGASVPATFARTEPGQAPPAAGSSRRITDISQLKNEYSSKLNSLGSEVGVDIGRIFSEQVTRCYNSKYNEVLKEAQTSGTELNLVAAKLANDQENFSVGGGPNGQGQPVSAIIGDLADKYREALGAAGFNVPVDTQLCLQGSPDTQANCVQALANSVKSSLTGVLSETSRTKLGDAAWQLTGKMLPRTNFDQPFKPENPKYAYLTTAMNCAGINACVTQLQDRIKTTQKSYESRVQEKRAFVSKANTELKKQAENLGNGFKTAGLELRKKIGQLEKAMQTAGFKMKKQRRDKDRPEGLKPQTRKNQHGETEDSLYAVEDLEDHALRTAGAPDILAELDAVQEGLSGNSDYQKDAIEMEKIAKQNLAQLRSMEEKCTAIAKSAEKEDRLAKEEKCMEFFNNNCSKSKEEALERLLALTTADAFKKKLGIEGVDQPATVSMGGFDCSKGYEGFRSRSCGYLFEGASKDEPLAGGHSAGNGRTAGSIR